VQDFVGVYSDAFVTKMTPSGRIVYSTFIGGSGSDFALAAAVDPAGNAYVGGCTDSGFPTRNPMFEFSHGRVFDEAQPVRIQSRIFNLSRSR
jgi:hypothetical protein